MSEITYLMVLGAIALIFPVLVVTVSAYMNVEVEEYTFINFDGEYTEIQNMNCLNIFEENINYGMTNYDLLRENMFTYFRGLNVSWIWRPYIQFGCFMSDTYVTDKIQENLLTPDEVIELAEEEQEKEGRGLFYRIKPNEFFRVLGTFPDAIRIFIYSFYGIFLGYLIWRTFTIG